ncbi:uncharacterized protein LOC135347851 isoform X1 [Halichondria panicea]|uniref:uncharacterized protein LOC135347851 isoform X1 n=1 Tax=Halichondria panicea TaxID=6063 RepID=UPI00312B94FB
MAAESIEMLVPLDSRDDNQDLPDTRLDIKETGVNQFSDAESIDYADDPYKFLSEDIWSRRKSLKEIKIKLTNTKEIAGYIQRAGNNDKALLNVILETDFAKFPEARIGLYVTELIQKGAEVMATDEEGNTPLHLAARRGLPDVAKELLRWGADPHTENNDEKVPLEIAILQALEIQSAMQNSIDSVDDYNAFAVLMCREMKPAKVRTLFLSRVDNEPQLSFHDLLDSEHLHDTVSAVMDTLIERIPGRKRTYTAYYDLLECNKEGRIARNSTSSLRRKLGKSAFEKIAWTGNKEAVTHMVVRLMMHSKWRRFARNFLIIHFFYWAITMVAISTALTIAAEQPNPHLYDQPVDIFRGICEGLAILLVTATSLTEIYNIYLWRLTYFTDYSFFLYNYLNLLTMIFIIVLIPLRAFALNQQWILACLIYVTYSSRVLRYITAIKILGKYVQILYLIIQRDLVPFICTLIIILYIFTGGFYFALRQEVVTPTLITPVCNFTVIEAALNTFNLTAAQIQDAVNTSTIPFQTSLDIHPDETRTYPQVFLTGIRIAVEGQNFLTYFGPGGFGWLGVVTYLIFLFTLEVVMLNLLIAQMSDTFSNVQGDAQRSLAINKARTIISIEKTGLTVLKCLTDFYESEEKWTNPLKHIEKLENTSITNIHRITLKTRKIVNQHSSVLDDLRGAFSEQSLTTNEKLDMILRNQLECKSK